MPKTIYVDLLDKGCNIYDIQDRVFLQVLEFYKSILPNDHRRKEISVLMGLSRTTLIMREKALGVYKPYKLNNGRRKKVR